MAEKIGALKRNSSIQYTLMTSKTKYAYQCKNKHMTIKKEDKEIKRRKELKEHKGR